MQRPLASLLAASSAVALLAACGGGSSKAKPAAPTVLITSPTDGARITGGSPTVTVTGTVTEGATVAVVANGGSPVDALVTGTSFTAQVALQPRGNVVDVTATNAGGQGVDSVGVFYPYLSLTTFQDASVVMGQANFVSTASDVFSATLYGDPAWDGSQLYLTDYDVGKVAVYAGVPTGNGVAPSFWLTSVNADTATPSTLNGPETVGTVGASLFLVDYSDNRVLLLDAAPTADGAAASVVVGQADPTSTDSGCTASTLDGPESAFVVGTRLIVGDSSNNRVLVWNTIPTSSGQAADLVLGQADFTSCSVNAGAALSAAGFNYPTDMWSDGTRLFVADYENSRILGWNTFPTVNGQAADFVLGQPDFATNVAGTSQGTLRYPYYLGSNGNQLFVADTNNNRVLVWNALPSGTGALPDVVLGQGDFDHGSQNDAGQDGSDHTVPAANTLNVPRGVLPLDDHLIVNDGHNHRYLVY
jgi:hypothetical protein